MKRNKALVVFVVILVSLSVAPLNAHTIDPTRSSDDYSTDNPIESLKEYLNRYRSEHPQSVDREVEVIVTVENGTTVPQSDEFTIERTYTRGGQRFMRGSIPMSEVRSLVEGPRLQSVRITSDQPINNNRIASGVAVINADVLHNRNIRGENVTVGIIDNDFWISHPAIAQSVGAYRSFSNTSNWQHGTAVASVIIDTAPGAELHLASIGSTTTPKEYAKAVRWLIQSGADIIIDCGSYYTQPGDGTGKISQIAANASSETVFITSVGNYAQRYWSGNYSAGTGWVTIHNGTQANFLNNGEPFSGTVRLTLRWDGWPNTSTNYDLYLFRKQPGQNAVVAKATGHNGRPFEYLKTSVTRGQYYVSIKAVNGPGQNETSHLELFASRKLLFQSPARPTAPANAQGVLAVGASENGTVEPFSVRGADIVAPDSVALEGVSLKGGTSFSAPYVAGTAALMLSTNPDLSSKEVRMILKMSADDIGPRGIDHRSGYGLVNATKAVKMANKMSVDENTDPTPRDVSSVPMHSGGYNARTALVAIK